MKAIQITKPAISHRIVIVANNASFQMGGEAALPLHYFRIFRQREIPVWLVIHERCRQELEGLLPDDSQFIVYARDTFMHKALYEVGRGLPHRLNVFTAQLAMRLLTQVAQRAAIMKLIATEKINVVHQPAPVSPADPSLMYGFPVPVVIGPLNGGMDYPPGFSASGSIVVRTTVDAARQVASFLNWLLPGKRRAAVVLAANTRTERALTAIGCHHCRLLPENGVDLSVFRPVTTQSARTNRNCCHFVFVGRLVDWKAVDFLLLAFQQAARRASVSLQIVGDGPEMMKLRQLADQLGIANNLPTLPGGIAFTGWLSQADCAQQLADGDVLVLPSLMECGGAVILEAMAISLPVIATRWGGPCDYLNEECGILVEPSSQDAFIQGLADAMVQLANNPELRTRLGAAGRERVLQHFDWEKKVDQILEIYGEAIARHSSNHPRLPLPQRTLQDATAQI